MIVIINKRIFSRKTRRVIRKELVFESNTLLYEYSVFRKINKILGYFFFGIIGYDFDEPSANECYGYIFLLFINLKKSFDCIQFLMILILLQVHSFSPILTLFCNLFFQSNSLFSSTILRNAQSFHNNYMKDTMILSS